MKIGVVDYLNAYPLYYNLENRPDVELVRDTPSRLAALLKEGRVDAALISSIEYYKHREQLEYLPDFCISAAGPVDSIRLFLSENHFTAKETLIKDLKHEITQQPGLFHVFYDEATRSSLTMTAILLNRITQGGLAANFRFLATLPPHDRTIAHLKKNEALLLIGDQALQHRKKTSIDIGEWYYKEFRQPTIFALWTFPRSITGEQKSKLTGLLRAGYAKSSEEKQNMLEAAVKRFGFTFDFTAKYLCSTIKYELGHREKQGLEFFFDEYEKTRF